MSRITLAAFGSSAGGKYAEFKLLVDGKIVGQATTTATKQLYTFDVAIDPAKPHSIAIRYENDATIAGADRNLFVSALQDKGRLDEAIAEHRKAIDIDPRDAKDRKSVV